RWPRDWSSDVCSSDLMGHIDEQLGPHLAGDLGEPAMRDFARIGAGSGDDQFGPMLARQPGDLVEVDAVRVARDAVTMEAIEPARSEERRVGKEGKMGG